MALFDIYKIEDKSRYFSQRAENVYFYQATSDVGNPDASDVADAYIGQVLPAVLTIQSPLVLHTEIVVTNLFNPSDVALVGISEPGVGAVTADELPAFAAVGFRLNQDNGAVKNGAKRYAGVMEEFQTDGVITGSGYMSDLDDLGDVLADVLVHGIIPTFVPIIVGRILTGGAYSLPDNLGDAVFGTVVEAIWNTLITSQTSRKIGVGE